MQSKPYSIKQLPVSPLGKLGTYENLVHTTNLARLYHSSTPCRVHAIHIQYFRYQRYWIFEQASFKQLSFLHFAVLWLSKIHHDVEKMVYEVLWNSLGAVLKLCTIKSRAHFSCTTQYAATQNMVHTTMPCKWQDRWLVWNGLPQWFSLSLIDGLWLAATVDVDFLAVLLVVLLDTLAMPRMPDGWGGGRSIRSWSDSTVVTNPE